MANNIDNILTSISDESINTLEQLYEIQTKNAPSNVFLPFINNIYNIDINTREIFGPDYLSLKRDHKAEIIYFKIDRFYDYMDLANTICIIQYLIPNEEIPRIYIVPFFDTYTYANENKMIFPWVIGGAITEQAGIVQYSIRFYKVQQEGKDIKLIYNLSTLPATSKILNTLQGDGEIMNAEYDKQLGNIDAALWEQLIAQLIGQQTTWTKL